MMDRRLGAVCLSLAVVTAGCIATGAGGPATQQASPSSPVEADCAAWVSFYGLGGPAERAWAPDRVAIGYTLPPGASVHFVVFEGDTVLGSTHASTEGTDHGVTADGDVIPLEEALTGPHEIQVRAYADVDGDDVFDAGTDRPCRYEGDLVRTNAQTIDFSRFHSDTPSPTPSPGD